MHQVLRTRKWVAPDVLASGLHLSGAACNLAGQLAARAMSAAKRSLHSIADPLETEVLGQDCTHRCTSVEQEETQFML